MAGGNETTVKTAAEESNRRIYEENRQLFTEQTNTEENNRKLEEIKRMADEAERAPKKERESVIGKFFKAVASTVSWLFGGYSKKDEKRTDRWNSEFQDMLVTKSAFQQGGKSAFAAQAYDSLTMVAREGSEDATADFSHASISRSRSDEGDNIEGGTVDIVYRDKLKLIAPSADFKHRYLSDSTTDYTTENAELMFMGAFRPLKTDSGKFNIQRNMSDKTDKFGEIASMEFDVGTQHVNMGRFLISDGDSKPIMNVSGSLAMVDSEGDFSVTATALTADPSGMEPIKATASSIKFYSGLAGVSEALPIANGFSFTESGFEDNGSQFATGKITEFQDILSADSISGNLKANEDGSLGTEMSISKWVCHYSNSLIDFIKGSDSAELSHDNAGLLHVKTPTALAYDLKLPLLGVSTKTTSTDNTEFIIGENSFAVTMSAENLFIGDALLTAPSFTFSKSGDEKSVEVSTTEIAVSEDITLKNVKAKVGTNGLEITSASYEINNFENDKITADKISGDAKGLELSKAGLFFENITTHIENLSVEDTFDADALDGTISRTAENGLEFVVDFKNLALDISGSDDGASVSSDNLSGTLTYKKAEKGIELKPDGTIDVTYGDAILVSLRGLSISYGENGFAMSIGKGYGKYEKDAESSIFGGAVDFETFYAHIKDVSIANKKMSFAEGGLFQLQFTKLKLFDKDVGDLLLQKNATGFKASLNDFPDVEKEIGNMKLKFSGGIGASYTTATKKFAPDFSKLRIDAKAGKIVASAEGFSLEDNDTLALDELKFGVVIDDLAGDDKTSTDENSLTVNGSELKFNKEGVQFKEICLSLNKDYTLWNDSVIIGHPSLGITNNFSGFSLGGMIGINNDWFEGSTSGKVFFEKENKYKPKLSALKDVSVSIPKLAKLSADTISFDEEAGKKVVNFEKLAFQSNFKPDLFQNKEGVFYNLCALGKDLKVGLKKAKIVDGKFDYNFEDITYAGSKFELKKDPFAFSVECTEEGAKVSAKVQADIPNKPLDAEKLGKDEFTRLFSLGISGPICPFVNAGGNFFGGADASIGLILEADINRKDKEFVGAITAEVEKAVAGLGIEGYISIGIPLLADIQLGVRGIVAGNLNDSKATGSLGVSFADKKPSIIKDPEKTKIDANLNGALTARLEAFVRPNLLLMSGKDLFKIQLCSANLFSFSLMGKGAYGEDEKWAFEKKFTYDTDFKKDAFDPKSKKSLLNVSKMTIADFEGLKSAVDGIDNAIGAQDWASDSALEKSVILQSEIIPKLEAIRKNSTDSFKHLGESDKKYVAETKEANEHINKHKKRLANATYAKESSKELEQLVMLRGSAEKGKGTNSGVMDDRAEEYIKNFAEKAGYYAPTAVWAVFSRFIDFKTTKYLKTIFSEDKLNEMMSSYVNVRQAISNIYKGPKPNLNANLLNKTLEIKQKEFNDFVSDKDTEFAKTVKDNKSAIKDLQKKNMEMVKMNEELEEIGKKVAELNAAVAKLQTEKDEAKIKELEKQGQELFGYLNRRKDLWLGKMNLTAEIETLRTKVKSASMQRGTELLSKQSDTFTQKRAAVKETRGNYLMSQLSDGIDKSELDSVSTLLSSKKSEKDEGKHFDGSELSALGYALPDGIETADYLTFEQLQAFANSALKSNAESNVRSYDELLSKLASNEIQSVMNDNESKRFLTYTFSSFGMDKAKEARTDKTKAVTLDDMIAYTQQRIDDYQQRLDFISNTETGLENNIVNSNALYGRASDIFLKLNAVHRSDFVAKSTYGNEGSDSLTFSDTYKTSLNSLVGAEKELKEGSDLSAGKINAFAAEANTTIENSKKIDAVVAELHSLNAKKETEQAS